MWQPLRILDTSNASAKQPPAGDDPEDGRYSPRVAVAVIGLLLVGLLAPVPQGGREVQALFDLLHAPIFAVVAVLVWPIRYNWLPRQRMSRAVVLWLGVSLLGVAIEYAQGLTGRHPSWDDALANACGAAAGLLWAGWRQPGMDLSRTTPHLTNHHDTDDSIHCERPRRAVTIRSLAVWTGVILLLSVAGWQPIVELNDAVRQRGEFPRLASFESRGELTRWTANDCRLTRREEHATHGSWSLRLDLQMGVYPGAALRWPLADWSGFEELVFDAYVADDQILDLVVKIHDRQHNYELSDRFQRPVRLAPGANRVSIPLAEVAAAPADRVLDLRQIHMLQFYTVRPSGPRVLYLDHIRLH